MSIRNNIEIARYDFTNGDITFRINGASYAFGNKLIDALLEYLPSMWLEDIENPSQYPYDYYLGGPITSWMALTVLDRPYLDTEIEEVIDAITIMLEQLPAKLRMTADELEGRKEA